MTSRRQVLYGLMGIGITNLPAANWVKPVVNSVLLPVHAQTSSEDPTQRNLPENTPPMGEDIIVDMQFSSLVRYDMSPHLSDAETPAAELLIAIVSLPVTGTIRLVAASTFEYELLSNPNSITSVSFTYFVQDPEGAKSSVYTVTIINLPLPGPQ